MCKTKDYLLTYLLTDAPGSEVQLPTLNVEDADDGDGKDGGGGSGQNSRRPSKLTLDAEDDGVAKLMTKNIVELAAAAVQQLEPEVADPQLAEVDS